MQVPASRRKFTDKADPMMKIAVIGLVAIITMAVAGIFIPRHTPASKPVASVAAAPVAPTDPCWIVGDSIAVGTATAESLPARYKPPCKMDAKIGIPSVAVIARVHPAALLVVSAGSNDARNPKLIANLETIRAKATGKVLWIVPNDPVAASAVMQVAHEHHDALTIFAVGRDHTHPKSYASILTAVREQLK